MADTPKHPMRRATDRAGSEPQGGDDAAPAANPRADSLQRDELGRVSHDEKGNPIWEWTERLQARRKDDEQVDYVECLGADDLSLDSDDDQSDAFTPYDKK